MARKGDNAAGHFGRYVTFVISSSFVDHKLLSRRLITVPWSCIALGGACCALFPQICRLYFDKRRYRMLRVRSTLMQILLVSRGRTNEIAGRFPKCNAGLGGIVHVWCERSWYLHPIQEAVFEFELQSHVHCGSILCHCCSRARPLGMVTVLLGMDVLQTLLQLRSRFLVYDWGILCTSMYLFGIWPKRILVREIIFNLLKMWVYVVW